MVVVATVAGEARRRLRLLRLWVTTLLTPFTVQVVVTWLPSVVSVALRLPVGLGGSGGDEGAAARNVAGGTTVLLPGLPVSVSGASNIPAACCLRAAASLSRAFCFRSAAVPSFWLRPIAVIRV